MKTKLMTIFAILAVMMTIVGCKPDSITEEEEQKVVDEVTIDLTRNDWESVQILEKADYTYTEIRTLHFTNSMVTVNGDCSDSDGGSFSYEHEGSYTINGDGKVVIITIGKNIHTLNYSKDKLTGFWGNNYLEFLPIK